MNEQSRNTGNIVHTRHRTKTNKTKNTQHSKRKRRETWTPPKIYNDLFSSFFNIEYYYINVSNNRRDNHEWATQRHWQHLPQDIEDTGNIYHKT